MSPRPTTFPGTLSCRRRRSREAPSPAWSPGRCSGRSSRWRSGTRGRQMDETRRDQIQQGNGRVETTHHPETDAKRKDKNYYGIPPIKRAHWTWQIPIYFWIGGIGAGVHLFSTMAQILGHKDEALTRASRYTLLLTMIVSPVLLIWDLGRPERFYNMLRILKLRSPMSTQSWSVFAFGNLGGLIAARQAAEDGLLGDDNFLVRLVKLIPARAPSHAFGRREDPPYPAPRREGHHRHRGRAHSRLPGEDEQVEQTAFLQRGSPALRRGHPHRRHSRADGPALQQGEPLQKHASVGARARRRPGLPLRHHKGRQDQRRRPRSLLHLRQRRERPAAGG